MKHINYILINPVVDNMYDKNYLNEILVSIGYQRVYNQQNWLEIVKQKYKVAIEESQGKTVADMRCPKAVELIKHKDLAFPNIEPIFIHCAREIVGRSDLSNGYKFIITPCDSIAEFGNALCLENTIFMSWIKFLKSHNLTHIMVRATMTPVPLGFFKELPVRQKSIFSEHQIKQHNFKCNECDIIELLYCDEGCHSGVNREDV